MLILNLTKVNLLRRHQTEFLPNRRNLPSNKKVFSQVERKTPSGKGEGERAPGFSPTHFHLQLILQKAKDP